MAEYVPTAHATQTLLAVVGVVVPAGQLAHVAWPDVLVMKPSWHSRHVAWPVPLL